MKSYCNNCSKIGHSSSNCKMPIISSGVIVCRFLPHEHASPEFLLICRKNTLGYVDFMRGKYSVYNKNYILNMMTQMTEEEKEKLRTLTFDALWADLWMKPVDLTAPESIRNDEKIIAEKRAFLAEGGVPVKRNEDAYVRERFHILIEGVYFKSTFYTLKTLLEESDAIPPAESGDTNAKPTKWTEPEWGFPKGRKNYQEKDLHCAFREFEEETGYSSKTIRIVENLLPFEEIFTGSNYKSYKHKYYLAVMNEYSNELPHFERGEVSRMGWFTYEECLEKIRFYNIEKRRLITNVNNIIKKYNLVR